MEEYVNICRELEKRYLRATMWERQFIRSFIHRVFDQEKPPTQRMLEVANKIIRKYSEEEAKEFEEYIFKASIVAFLGKYKVYYKLYEICENIRTKAMYGGFRLSPKQKKVIDLAIKQLRGKLSKEDLERRYCILWKSVKVGDIVGD